LTKQQLTIMSNETFPITPPPELFAQWEDDILESRDNVDYVLDCAWRNGFQAGADQELEACCEWLKTKEWIHPEFSDELRDLRRPKPPSLKKQALLAIDTAVADGRLSPDVSNVVRRALEHIPDTH
jgi:hypothetical protein